VPIVVGGDEVWSKFYSLGHIVLRAISALGWERYPSIGLGFSLRQTSKSRVTEPLGIRRRQFTNKIKIKIKGWCKRKWSIAMYVSSDEAQCAQGLKVGDGKREWREGRGKIRAPTTAVGVIVRPAGVQASRRQAAALQREEMMESG
jgi:hypothetical protein